MNKRIFVVCVLLVLGIAGERKAAAALYAISGSGTSVEMGTVGGGDVFLNPTFTFQIIFDDSVVPLVMTSSNQIGAFFENAITSMIIDGQEQIDPFATVGNQVGLTNRLSSSLVDSVTGFIDNANLTIDGSFGNYFSGTPSLHDLSGGFNLVVSQG